MLAGHPTRFYPIVDRELCARRGVDPSALAAACLDAGARVIQLRVKGGSSAAFLELADGLVRLAEPYGAAIIVNDRADIALLSGAAGVHVGQDDLPPDATRRIVGARTVGFSTHDERQVDAGLEADVDYVAVGPIYGTTTKDTGYEQRGLGLVAYAANRGKPIVAIGGITLERAPHVIRAGASAVAVISDLLQRDVKARAAQYVRALDGDGVLSGKP